MRTGASDLLNHTGGFGTVDDRGEAEEYDVRGGGLNFGVDYGLGEMFVAGIGAGWNIQSSDSDDLAAADGSGNTGRRRRDRLDAYTASLYSEHLPRPAAMSTASSPTPTSTTSSTARSSCSALG